MDVRVILETEFQQALRELPEVEWRGGLAGARQRRMRRNKAKKIAYSRTRARVGADAWAAFRNTTAPRARVRRERRRARNRVG